MFPNMSVGLAHFQDNLKQFYEQYAAGHHRMRPLHHPVPPSDCHTYILLAPCEAAAESHDLSTVAVVSKGVDGAAWDAGDDTRRGQSLDAGGDRGGRGQTLESLEVENQAGDVGGSHGGARDAVARRSGSNPGGRDAAARGKDVDSASKVRVGRPAVGAGGGTDSDGVWSRGR